MLTIGMKVRINPDIKLENVLEGGDIERLQRAQVVGEIVNHRACDDYPYEVMFTGFFRDDYFTPFNDFELVAVEE